MLLDDPTSSPTGRWRVRPIGGNHERAEPVSLDRFGHGQASRQALKTVFFRLQSLSRHSELVVWRSSRGDGSSSLVFSYRICAVGTLEILLLNRLEEKSAFWEEHL